MADNNQGRNFEDIVEIYDNNNDRSMGVLSKKAGDVIKMMSDCTIANCTYTDAINILRTKLALNKSLGDTSGDADIMWFATDEGKLVNELNTYEDYYISDLIHTKTEDNGLTIISKRIYNPSNSYTMKAVISQNESDSNYTLTFYYDDMDHTIDGECYSVDGNAFWRSSEYFSNVTSIVFDESFALAKPTSCKEWFKCDIEHSHNARYITNIEYLNTSKCGSFESMFYGSRFIELDVSNFNVSSAISFESMFQECRGLRTIYSNNTSPWKGNPSGYKSKNMFDGCTSLQYYRRDKLDISAAFAGRDGYFTLKQD